ncbi:hypothetical protein [Microbulbifer epialgicus]|uniref:DUF4143 domain-containing protein n=1 Tax=Microbulbifer epialgicus TaxID=393907 RepID=A0ABV4NT80_9GAMM
MPVVKATALDALYGLFLREGRFDYSDELICQNQIEKFLTARDIKYFREHSLSGAEVTDFYFPNSKLVLEVKAGKNWSKRRVYRQVERYCAHPDVEGLLLATGKVQGLPEAINGCPVRIYQMGLGFL